MSKKPTLTENQKKFATLLVYEAGRKSPAECAFESGYKTRPRPAASELKNPKIYPLVAAFINELREEAKEKYGVNFQKHLMADQYLTSMVVSDHLIPDSSMQSIYIPMMQTVELILNSREFSMMKSIQFSVVDSVSRWEKSFCVDVVVDAVT